MEYDLARIDYILCGITYPDTLKILPNPGHKTQQKFAVGDKNGVLQCLCIKDEEPIVQFKTLPGKPITSIQVASTNGNHIDKIFAASGHEVKGYTRKGKVFLTIETSVSETITSMCILNSDLILCSGRTVTFYRDLREIYSYVCEDRVLDIAAFAAPNSTRVRLLVLVGNKGAAVIENGEILARTQISSGPTRLIVPTAHRSAEIAVFYGAADGSIGLIQYDLFIRTDLSSKCLVEGGGLGAVVCVGWYLSNGAHLAVGRHDGSVQLYLVDLDNVNEKPRLKFTYFCGEPITSVCGGSVGTEEIELLVSTFSGRVFALRSQRLISGGVALNNMTPEALVSRRNKLELEVARLEKQTAAEREKYQRNTRSLNAGMSTPPLLEIQYELTGAMLNGWQEVIITAGVPLDMLFIYCNKKLEVQTDTAAVLSVCPPQGNTSEILATVRCQAGTRRIWLQMRTTVNSGPEISEGTQVLVYVLPAGAPRVARLIKLSLPALPQYSQHDDPDRDDDRVWCELRLSGGFSVAEMTSWLSEALPGDLPRPAASIAFARVHCLLKTILICRYQRGSASIKSDNVSTISTLKDLLSYCSLKRAIRVDISCDIPEMCCSILFKSIKDRFLSEYQRKKEFILKEAIGALDLDMNTITNESEPILCEEYLRVWKSVDDTKNVQYFNELVATVEQWYTDWCKLSLYGRDNSSQKSQLKTALQDCQVNDIERILTLKDLQIDSHM
ncbi:PREDICTED: Bardet-Biedl syndrome 7 protein homolog isoform X2 [Papilio polytes]|uniref:Bardet-Biedl syndrome 7 protein homolog isoform X2 n=1 Tax=Papilio polytes TaxID=76194 RepID=UPI000675DD34|nr:PREDICTED: Bardet-Biedl syndrome 7 protein homolog isoform X2 [Papilio polytes]